MSYTVDYERFPGVVVVTGPLPIGDLVAFRSAWTKKFGRGALVDGVLGGHLGASMVAGSPEGLARARQALGIALGPPEEERGVAVSIEPAGSEG